MPVTQYLSGLAWLAVVVGAHVVVAVRLRTRLGAALSGPGGRLATAVLFAVSLLAVGQVLGAMGLLSRWPVLVGSVLLAAVVVWVTRAAPRPAPATPERSSARRLEPLSVVAAAAVAAVAWQWTTHLADAFDRGMVQADNLWYHGPFAAHLLQTGGFGDLGTLGYPEARSFPLSSQLLHALLSMPFDTDLVVPVANHLFAALALGASYVLGRRWGVGSLAVLGTAVVLSLPLIGSTQPGQMYNDVMASALVLAAVALVVDGGLSPGTAAVVGAALGTALGTKLSVLGVVAPLVVGLVVAALATRRWRSALALCATAGATGAFWPVRTWIVHGSPAPYADLRLGPIDLPATVDPDAGETLYGSLSALDEWGRYYLDSLEVSLGPLWALPVVLGTAACLFLLVRARDVRFLAAAAALVGLATFPALPVTGRLPFVNNLRYGIPALALAVALAAVAAAPRRWLRVGLAVAWLACLLTNLAADHRGRVPAWPGHHAWGLVVAALVLVAAAAIVVRQRVGAPRQIVAVGAVAVLLVALGGWALQEHYLERRYVDSGLVYDPVHTVFHDVADARVDVFGTIESYAYFGPDLSNEVIVWNEELARIDDVRACRYWRTAFGEGSGYIVVGSGEPFGLHLVTAEERAAWFEDDPAVTVVLEDGERTVYRRDRALDPDGC